MGMSRFTQAHANQTVCRFEACLFSFNLFIATLGEFHTPNGCISLIKNLGHRPLESAEKCLATARANGFESVHRVLPLSHSAWPPGCLYTYTFSETGEVCADIFHITMLKVDAVCDGHSGIKQTTVNM